MKAGVVALIGRPNAGKSTLLNNILKQKVAITSPKPQTTRFSAQAVYEDSRGQIVFVDTPGVFSRTKDPLARRINPSAQEALNQGIDVVVYLIDHTREREQEENKALGMVRKVKSPKILALNKIDVREPDHRIQYKFIEEEVDAVVELSALTGKNIPRLLDTIFSFLPYGEPLVDTSTMIQPGLNMHSKTFVAELIREKAFLFLRREVPYTLTVVVDEITQRKAGALYIKARILTNDERYKPMIIGKGGTMIKEISMAARKELETAGNNKVFLELTVEVDPRWMDYL